MITYNISYISSLIKHQNILYQAELKTCHNNDPNTQLIKGKS
jgi:hypothetical protein